MLEASRSYGGVGIIIAIFIVVVVVLISKFVAFEGEDDSIRIPFVRSSLQRQSDSLERFEIKNQADIAGWNVYADTQYRFRFSYPSDWRVRRGDQPMGLDANLIIPQEQKDCDPEETCENVVQFGIVENPDRLSARLLMERKFGWSVEVVHDFRPVMIKEKKCYAFTIMNPEDAHLDQAVWVPLDKTHFLSFSGSYLRDAEKQVFDTMARTLEIKK